MDGHLQSGDEDPAGNTSGWYARLRPDRLLAIAITPLPTGTILGIVPVLLFYSPFAAKNGSSYNDLVKFFSWLRAYFYYTYFRVIERLLPQFVFKEKVIDRDNLHFKLYVQILRMYAAAIESLDKEKDLYRQFRQFRLRQIVAVANKTTWWRSYFKKSNIHPSTIKTSDDLSKIPPVTRFDLVDVDKKELLILPADNPTVVWRRSGGSTTGTPFHWALNKTLLTLHVMARFVLAIERHLPLSAFAKNGAYVEINYPHGSSRSEFKWLSIGDFSVWSDDQSDDVRFTELISALSRLNHLAIRITPSELHWFAGELRERNVHLPVLFFSVTGQLLEPGVRTFVQNYFNCPVLVHYGAQEMGPLSIECAEHLDHYHLFQERVIAEVLDDEDNSLPPGSAGNLTITVLDNTVMPLIRYQPGDLAILHTNLRCSCRNQAPLLEIRSRSTDILKLSKGEILPIRRILRSFGVEPFVSNVKRFQVRQEKLDEVLVLIVPRKPFLPKVLSDLQEQLYNFYEGKIAVRIKVVDEIIKDGPKFKVFVPLRLTGEPSKPA